MNRTVLITGVNGGIGTSIARTFREAGWTVIGVDIRGVTNDYCDLFLPADVSDPESIRSILDVVSAKYAKLECLINNAAVQVEKTLIDTTPDEWHWVFRTNVDQIYHTTRTFISLLANASLINISSVHSKATSKGLAAYAASKGAISSLTRAMALELADRGIRVNAILPGAIGTTMLEKGLNRSNALAEARETLMHTTPLKKIGNPDDVANLALFLADTSKSGNITGQEFVCDGGVLARLATE